MGSKNSPNGEKEKVIIEFSFYVYFQHKEFNIEIDISFVITNSLRRDSLINFQRIFTTTIVQLSEI